MSSSPWGWALGEGDVDIAAPFLMAVVSRWARRVDPPQKGLASHRAFEDTETTTSTTLKFHDS